MRGILVPMSNREGRRPTNERSVVRATLGSSGGRGFLLVAAPLILVGSAVGAALLGSQFGPPGLFVALGIGLIALVPVVAIGVRRMLRWHPPELIMAASTLAIGETVTATYRLAARRPRDLAACDLTYTLRCTEFTNNGRSGERRRQDRRTVHEVTATTRSERSTEAIEAPLRIAVPVDAGGPTLELPGNRVWWTLTVQRSGPGGGLGDEFTLPVEAVFRPSVARAAGRGDRHATTAGPSPLELRLDGHRLTVENAVAEIGGAFRCHLQSNDGASRPDARAGGVQVTIGYVAQGTWRTDRRTVATRWFARATELTFDLDVGTDVPVSYRGELVSVRWELGISHGQSPGQGSTRTGTVFVVPAGGLGTYRGSHPLSSRPPRRL